MREAALHQHHIQLGSERPGGTRLIDTVRSALVEVPCPSGWLVWCC